MLPSNLKDLIKSKIKTSLKSVSGWKILVLDSESLQVLDSSCKMTEILSENVTMVESLSKKRKPSPDKNAVYFISPTLTSVQLMLNDFEKRPVMYATCNVFCLAALSDSLFDRIKNSPAKQYMRNLVELNIDFTSPDPNYFSIDTPEAFLPVFNPEHGGALIDYEIDNMAKRIVSVLVNLGEYPHIRYHSKPQAFQTTPTKSKSYLLAMSIQKELDYVCRNDQSFPPANSQNYERAALIICDRGIDVAGVFLHDLHYQSLLSDLYSVCRNKFIDEETKKESILDDSDMFWSKIRTWHISESMEYVAQQFSKFKDENKAAQWQLGSGNGSGSNTANSIEALKDVMTSFGDYAATKEAVSRHQNLCLGISRVFERRGLELVVDLEQDLIMTDPSDHSKFSKLVKKTIEMLSRPNLEYHDKIRLLFLLIAAKEGVSDEEREILITAASVKNEELQAMVNLNLLEVKLSSALGRQRKVNESRNPYSRSAITKRIRMESTPKFENDRYIPTLYFIMQDQINNKLDTNWFPWVKEPPPTSVLSPGNSYPTDSRPATWAAGDSSNSAGPPLPTRKKPSWATRKASTPSTPLLDTPSTTTNTTHTVPNIDLRRNGPRVLMFVIGGVTYSELRHVTQLQGETSRECYIGSTHAWTPDSFVEALKFGGGGDKKDRRRGAVAAGAPFFEFQRPPPRPERSEMDMSDRHHAKSNRSPRSQSKESSRNDSPKNNLFKNESNGRNSPLREQHSSTNESYRNQSSRKESSSRSSPPRERRSPPIPHRRESDREPPSDQMSRMQMNDRRDYDRRDYRPPTSERSRSANHTSSNGNVNTTEKKKGWFGF